MGDDSPRSLDTPSPHIKTSNELLQEAVNNIRALPQDKAFTTLISFRYYKDPSFRASLYAIAIDEKKYELANTIRFSSEDHSVSPDNAILEIRTKEGAEKLIADHKLKVADEKSSLLGRALSQGKYASIPALLSVTPLTPPLGEKLISQAIDSVDAATKPLAGAVLIHGLRHLNNEQASKVKNTLIQQIKIKVNSQAQTESKSAEFTDPDSSPTRSLREYWNAKTKSYHDDAKILINSFHQDISRFTQTQKQEIRDNIAKKKQMHFWNKKVKNILINTDDIPDAKSYKILLAVHHGYHGLSAKEIATKKNDSDWENAIQKSIMTFIQDNNIVALKSLIEEFDIDVKTFQASFFNQTCLEFAKECGREAIIRYLKNQNLNAFDSKGNTSLAYAIASKDFNEIQALINAGADPIRTFRSKNLSEPKNTLRFSHQEVSNRVLANQSIFARQQATSAQITEITSISVSAVCDLVSQYEIGEVPVTKATAAKP